MKVIILAGGSGSRLWPLSNNDTPKQLLKIDSPYSLLQNTFLRAREFASPEDILVVTGKDFREKTFNQLQEVSGTCRILSEPCAKNTAPAICCALEYLARQKHDDAVVILPADHLISDHAAFRFTVMQAIELAELGNIVTLGIKPHYPETGFGYIKTAGKLHEGFKVERFVEKPALETAREYVASGNYFWNGGIFVGKISTFMHEFSRFTPEIADLAGRCVFENDNIDAEIFDRMPKISVDYAIMERSDRIALVKLLSDWSDLGSWQAIYELKNKDENGNVIIGSAVLHNVRNSLVYSPERSCAVADMENMVLVNTENVTMTCVLDRSQNVKYLQ